MRTKTDRQYTRLAFVVLALVLAGASLRIARPYLNTAILALILAYIVQPLYHGLLDKINPRKQRASVISTIIVMIFTLLLCTVLLLAMLRIMSLVMTELRNLRLSQQAEMDVLEEAAEWLNLFFARIQVPVYITPDQVYTNIQNYITQIVSFLLSTVRSIGTLSASVLINLIIFYGLIFLITPHFDDLVAFIKKISPLADDISHLYLFRALNTAKAMVWGLFIIAVVQGGLAGLTFSILGIKNWLLLTVITALLSFIPMMGAGMVTLPIAVILFAQGHIFKGIVLTLVQLIIIGNIDTVLRAKLIPREVKMPLVISLMAILGGLALFGIWGLIYGPVIFSLLLATIEIIKKEPAEELASVTPAAQETAGEETAHKPAGVENA